MKAFAICLMLGCLMVLTAGCETGPGQECPEKRVCDGNKLMLAFFCDGMDAPYTDTSLLIDCENEGEKPFCETSPDVEQSDARCTATDPGGNTTDGDMEEEAEVDGDDEAVDGDK